VKLNRSFALFLILGLAACGGGDTGTPTQQLVLNVGELVVEDTLVGTGPVAEVGDTVKVDYVGQLEDGSEFDNSYVRGEPFEFTIGAGTVIAGWDQGVTGMRVGGTRRLTIPPNLAYGLSGRGPIPPNATLIFDVELVSIAGK
jgi:FKBP-type peptidyl-prolyl cis-trans isomerase